MSSATYRRFTGTGAENYERYFVPAIALPVSRELLARADLKPGERVLDVACGTGIIARLAADRVGAGGAVSAVDLAPDMIEMARSMQSSSGAPVEWHVGDGAALPFDEDHFDVVLCQMGLMFMSDRSAALREMRRVARPGGRVVISTPGQIQPAFQIMQQSIVEHIDPELGRFVGVVFSMHDPAALASLLRDADLREVSAGVTVTPLNLPPPAEFLWQYINLTPMGPSVAKAPEAAQAAMERQAVEHWRPCVVDGRLRVDQPMVIASGRK